MCLLAKYEVGTRCEDSIQPFVTTFLVCSRKYLLRAQYVGWALCEDYSLWSGCYADGRYFASGERLCVEPRT